MNVTIRLDIPLLGRSESQQIRPIIDNASLSECIQHRATTLCVIILIYLLSNNFPIQYLHNQLLTKTTPLPPLQLKTFLTFLKKLTEKSSAQSPSLLDDPLKFK